MQFADRAEGGHARGAEEDLAVRRLGADRRPPHHAHQLVRPLGGVHEILHEPVAERREGAGDRADQYADLGVVEDRVDDLPAAPVADRVAAVVDRVGHAQVLGYPLVQLGLLGLRQRRAASAPPRSPGRRSARPCRPRSSRRRRRRRGAAARGPTGSRCPGVRPGRRPGSPRTAASPRPPPRPRRSACRCGRRPCGRRSRCGRP